ncbi:MAG: ACP S-malonyltransferase [Acidobacteriota bacterium]
MDKVAFVFPGQASQYPGMGRDLYEKHPEARMVFEEADAALGFAISKLCFEGSQSDLELTANTQPAILVVSIAAYRVLQALGMRPDYVAGHSLGEYSALVAAGALELATAVQLVRKRGQYMQEAVPVGMGAMAAIIGANAELVQEICAQVAEGEVCMPANINTPSQLVVAGHRSAVERAINEIKSRRAGRAKMLAVSAPFHCVLMKPAEEALACDLAEVEFRDLEIPLVSNVDAGLICAAAEARASLIRQVCSPVRWSDSIRILIENGVRRFVEVGPKNVLIGLIKNMATDLTLLNVEDSDSAQRAVSFP